MQPKFMESVTAYRPQEASKRFGPTSKPAACKMQRESFQAQTKKSIFVRQQKLGQPAAISQGEELKIAGVRALNLILPDLRPTLNLDFHSD